MSDPSSIATHRHGRHVHSHAHRESHRHLLMPRRSQPLADHDDREHDHVHGHDHSHGLIDRSIIRSREGVKAVSISLGVLGLVAGAQAAIFLLSGSVALLADLIHNVGDALTAVPLGLPSSFARTVARSSQGSQSSWRSSCQPASLSTRRSSV